MQIVSNRVDLDLIGEIWRARQLRNFEREGFPTLRVFSPRIFKKVHRETLHACPCTREDRAGNRRFKLSSRVSFPLTLAYQIYGPRRLSLIRFNSSSFRHRLVILNEFTPIPASRVLPSPRLWQILLKWKKPERIRITLERTRGGKYRIRRIVFFND